MLKSNISQIKKITPMLKSRFTKLKSLDQNMIGDDWEIHLESFFIPFGYFQKNDHDFNFNQISKIVLVFDKCPYGVVAIDDIGYSTKKE